VPADEEDVALLVSAISSLSLFGGVRGGDGLMVMVDDELAIGVLGRLGDVVAAARELATIWSDMFFGDFLFEGYARLFVVCRSQVTAVCVLSYLSDRSPCTVFRHRHRATGKFAA
jgi:hypothetical protein